MPRSLTRYAHVVLGLLGLAAAVVMLRHTDFAAVRAFGPVAGLVVAMEGLRVLAEIMATRTLLGREVHVPWSVLLRVHVTGYAIGMVMPAGRTAAEASKALMLRPLVGDARCAGVAATNQALVMAAGGVVLVPYAGAAWACGHAKLGAVLVAQKLWLLLLGFGLLALLRNGRLSEQVAARWPRLAPYVRGTGTTSRVPGVPRALGWFVAHRLVQALQLGTLLATLGAFTPLRTLAFAGAAIVGTSLGVAVPGQLGVVGGALALAATGLGLTAAQGLALALLLHVAQFSWVALGFATWAVTKPASHEA